MTEVQNLLASLVARPSVTPDDAGCQAIVRSRLESLGFASETIDEGGVTNLWATHGSGGPLLCFAGHTDVVPTGPLDAWVSPPFEPTVRDGHLFGRGSADMKSGDAAMVVALERLAAEGHPGTVALLLTSDEEGPGVYGTKYVLETLAARGTRIDAAIVGEPTSETAFGDTVKIGRRGSMSGTWIVEGKQGHTAYPQLAENAIHAMAPMLFALTEIDLGHGNAEFPPTTLQVTNIVAGTGAGNVIPGRVEIHFNLRFGTDWTAESLQGKVESVIGTNVAWDCSAYPFLTAPGALLESLSGAVQAVTGLSPKASTGGGTSDARFFAAHQIPVAEFGVINATIHAANECVRMADVDGLVDVFVEVGRRYFATK